MTLARSKLVDDFLSHLSAERGLSGNSLQAYDHDLEQFQEFCRLKKINERELDQKSARLFVASLRKRGLVPRSIARKVTALRQFYRFLLREGIVTSDPTELLSIRLRLRKLPRHLSQAEMVQLLSAIDPSEPEGVRDRALFELWYATGARVSEIVTLTPDKIDLKAKTVWILGKGNRERLVPIHDLAAEWCKRYADIRHEWVRELNLQAAERFFITSTGRALSRQTLWKAVKQYAERAGLAKRIHPHMIRHSFATHVLRNGADLRVVQELLGHRNISTTEIYTHIAFDTLSQMQQKYHPRG